LNSGINNLFCSYGYENDKEICPIENFSKEFESGKIYHLSGDNGSGKSTFLKSLLGLVPNQRGSVTIDQGTNGIESVHSFDVKHLRDHVDSMFYMPQNTLNMFPTNTCALTYLSYLDRRPNIISELKIKYPLFDKLLDEIEWRHMEHISGGQRQLLSIFAMYVSNSNVVLLDEPTSEISATNSDTANTLIKEFLSEERIIFLATHCAKLGAISDETVKLRA